MLGVHPSTVAHMVQRGELRSYRTKPSLSRRQVEAVAELRRRFRMKASVAAGHLRVGTPTLLRWLDAGIVPGHRTVRGRWWLDPEDVWAIRTEGRDLVGRSAAAEILGVSGTRVTQLAEADLMPYVEVRVGRSVRRMFRRGQLEVVANARDARWSRWH